MKIASRWRMSRQSICEQIGYKLKEIFIMKKLNIGLIGAGFMGKAHVVAYSNMPKFFWPAPAMPVLKTICDIEPSIAEDARERFGFEKSCTDWHDIINDPEIDVVSICTPNDSHAPIAIAALQAGKHVICEKPIASTLEDAKAMAEVAEEAAKKRDELLKKTL